MGAAGGEIHDPSPEDIASVSMVKVWPTLKDLEDRHTPEPRGDKGPNRQVGMTKHVMPPGSRKREKKIHCVTSLAQTHNIEETVTRPHPNLEDTGNPEQSTEARDWRPEQQVLGVNNPQFRSYKTDPEESRRAIKRTMSGEKSEPTDQHEGIFECIQREGESNRDWIRRHPRLSPKDGDRMGTNPTTTRPRLLPKDGGRMESNPATKGRAHDS